ncbi:kinase-like domain-containing protein [Rhizophagus irregularis DAOM 181602=DAOM 197198]|nr:kinase-like domain-containing protein [Rhizophagus irregularis DAOM 181602=DAOM 197198]
MELQNLSQKIKSTKQKIISCSVSCLHDEGIVHRDLHSCNVLVHQNSIRLADFGLSKRIDEASRTRSKLLESNKIGLIYEISQNRREEIIPNTPNDYSNLYTGCWNGEPINRPNIHEVVNRLKFISNSSNSVTTCQQNDISNQTNSKLSEILTPSSTIISLHGELSQMIESFNNMNTNEIDMMTSTIKQINDNVSSENLSIIVDEIVDLIFKVGNKWNVVEQHVLNYLNNHNINSKEIYNWLLDNQNISNFIFLLGFFYYAGIETIRNHEKAFNLFINASEEGHILAQYLVGHCYEFGDGIIRNDNLAFENYEKLANKDYAIGQFKLGWFYDNGLYVKKDPKLAAYWFEKAVKNGNLVAMFNLGILYINGNGVDENHQKAFELFKQSAEGEDLDGIMLLGDCYNDGIGINIDKRKAAELYQKAANLGHKVAQYNLATMYEKGGGIEKDLDKAIYWYEQSTKHI